MLIFFIFLSSPWTIQEQINISNGGDIVLISRGYYDEDIEIINKNISLIAIHGPESTRINSIYTEFSDATILGFTINQGQSEFRFGAPTIAHCIFEDIVGPVGAALSNVSSPHFSDCIFRNNGAADFPGGALFVYKGAPSFDRCQFIENWSSVGGALFLYKSSPPIRNCLFYNNMAKIDGPALFFDPFSIAKIDTCTIIGNDLEEAGETAGVIHVSHALSKITNSIIWDNAGNDLPPLFSQNITLLFNCIEDTEVYDNKRANQSENISLDPLLEENGAPGANSPIIDQGEPNYIGSELDLYGRPRVVGIFVDMGAVEYQCEAY